LKGRLLASLWCTVLTGCQEQMIAEGRVKKYTYRYKDVIASAKTLEGHKNRRYANRHG
jgi:hypothetical protein